MHQTKKYKSERQINELKKKKNQQHFFLYTKKLLPQ